MEDKKVVSKIEKETRDIVAQAKSIVITNQAQYESANVFLRADKMLQKSIKATFDPIVDSAYRTYKEAGNKRKEFLEPVQDAEKVVKDIMIAYDDKMEAKRREEQRKIDLKAEIEAEKKRKDLEKRAEEWAAKGKTAKAEELQEQAEEVEVVAPVVAAKVEKIVGLSYQTNWKFKITDIDKIPREYMIPDEVALKKMAGVMKDIRKIAGVEFYSVKIAKSTGRGN